MASEVFNWTMRTSVFSPAEKLVVLYLERNRHLQDVTVSELAGHCMIDQGVVRRAISKSERLRLVSVKQGHPMTVRPQFHLSDIANKGAR